MADSSTPISPERSGLPPSTKIMSESTFSSSLSPPQGIFVIIPSALKAVPANIFNGSEKSSTVISPASGLPKSANICLALANKAAPSGDESSMFESSSEGDDSNSLDLSFRKRHTHSTAATTSLWRMLKSLSESMRSSVLESNTSPSVGQLRAAHSFWSREPMFSMSDASDIST